MKPPHQPHPRKAGEIVQGLLKIISRQQLEHVSLRFDLQRLMARLKLHLLESADEADGAESELGETRLQTREPLPGGQTTGKAAFALSRRSSHPVSAIARVRHPVHMTQRIIHLPTAAERLSLQNN